MTETQRDFRFGSFEYAHSVHCALSAMRLGSADPVHAEKLFSLFALHSLLSKYSSGTLVLTRAGRNDEAFCCAQDKSRGSKRNIYYVST